MIIEIDHDGGWHLMFEDGEEEVVDRHMFVRETAYGDAYEREQRNKKRWDDFLQDELK